MVNLLIAFVLVAHGIVHPILAYLPSRDAAQIVGGLWTKSWLLGEGALSKQIIWAGSVVTFVLFVMSGLSAMGWIFPQAWWPTLTVAAAGVSLLLLVVFWFTEFILGVAIDVILLALILIIHWSPALLS